MSTKQILLTAVIMMVLLLVVTGCGGKRELPTGTGAEWDLVIIGDSSMWGLGDAYAAQIEKDLGVKVIVHDYANNAASAGEVLEVLQTGKSMNARTTGLLDSIKDAEVVVMNLNLEDSIDPDDPVNLDGCLMMMKPLNCAPSSFTKYTEDLESIWAKILELRKGKPTILRATDLYNPLINLWKENGVYEDCTTCWINLSTAARNAAKTYNIPFLARLEAFNGPNYDEDPVEKGYITEDGEHPSELGAQFTAELLADMGYTPVSPP